MHFSRPYYVTGQTIAVQKSNDTILSLEDLKSRRVGTLAGSLAKRTLSEQAFEMDIVTYSEENETFTFYGVTAPDDETLEYYVPIFQILLWSITPLES